MGNYVQVIMLHAINNIIDHANNFAINHVIDHAKSTDTSHFCLFNLCCTRERTLLLKSMFKRNEINFQVNKTFKFKLSNKKKLDVTCSR